MSATGSTSNSSIAPPHRESRRRALFPLIRSFFAIARDPNNTSHGARVVMTIDRQPIEQCFQRFAKDPAGARILAGAPSLYDRLTDRESLEAMPEGSLGRSYLDFMRAEGISTEELDRVVAPVEAEVLQPDAVRRRFHRHMRASHDLWHVLTGYHRDVLGELQLIIFSREQTHSRAFGWLSRLARVGPAGRLPGARELFELATRRGRDARWLPTAPWETLLPRPIDEVRCELGVGEPPSYTRYNRRPSGFGLMPEEEAA